MLPISDELIDHLCTGSDRQIDDSLFPRLQALKHRTDESVKTEVREIIGDCIMFSLCSSFVLTVFQTVFYVDCCGGKLEDVLPVIRNRPVEFS